MVLGVLGSFLTQTVVRAGHVHERVLYASVSKPACGHHGHSGCEERRSPERSDRSDKGTCELCLKLTFAKFSVVVGGAPGGLVLPRLVVPAVEATETVNTGVLTMLRATSRGPPTLA